MDKSRSGQSGARRRRVAVILAILTATPPLRGHTRQSPAEISALLERQTQELMDSIATGNRDPWQRYVHDDIVYAAEDGSTKSKAELLDELHAFPNEIWGKLRVTRFRTVVHGSTVVANYVSEEEEGYFGQTIHARYLSTDTWIETDAGWRLIASQVLALRDDPPAVKLPPAKLEEYVGTYALTPDVTYTVRRDQNTLIGQRTGRKPEPLRIEVPDCLFVPGQPRLRKIFQRNLEGRVTGFVERRETWDIAWRRVK